MEKYLELLDQQRTHFVQSIDAERLMPYLQSELTDTDWVEINKQPSQAAKVEKILELVPSKGSEASHALCVALDSTHPHLRTLMLLPYVGVGTGSSPIITPTHSSSTASSATSMFIEGQMQLPEPPEEPPPPVPVTVTMQDEATSHRESPRLYPPPVPVSVSPTPDYTFGGPNSMNQLKAELQHVTDDKNILKQELQKVQKKLEGYTRLSGMESPRPQTPINTSLAGMLPARPISVSLPGPMEKTTSRSIEQLKTQCDSAMNELIVLQNQHAETMKKCEQAVKEKEYYKLHLRETNDKLTQFENELHRVKAQCNEVTAERQKLEQEVLDLQKLHDQDQAEIMELHQQQREVMSESGSSEVLNKMYDTAIDKYEAVKRENDNLRKQYSELLAAHNVTTENLKLDNSKLRKQYNDAIAERNAIRDERNGLKHQCTTAVQKWNNAVHEREEIQETLNKMLMDRDKYRKECETERALRMKMLVERNHMKGDVEGYRREIALIMSERDEVHKEIKQLESKLAQASKQAEGLEMEKKGRQSEVDNLRRELTAAQQARDLALKQVNTFKENYGQLANRNAQAEKEVITVRNNIDQLQQKWEVAERERQEAMEHRDRILYEQFEKNQRGLSDEKELENLRKEVDRLRTELRDAHLEAEDSCKKRELACTERDKIVSERESIRMLCDKLRKDRDQRVSELFEALRESDELKKQKNEAIRELKELKDKCDSLMEKETRKNQLNSVGHNNSHDSAIDTDLQEWELETMEVTIGSVGQGEMGFELAGGKDDTQYPEHAIFISSVTKGGPVDGKLKLNDQLVRVNNVDITTMEKKTAVEIIKNSQGNINMVVRRRKLAHRAVHPVHLNMSNGEEPGFSIEPGLYVSRIIPSSVAAKEGTLAVGDRILAINGVPVETMSAREAHKFIAECGEQVVLNVMKYCASHPIMGSTMASGNLTETSPDTGTGLSPRSTDTGWTPSPQQDEQGIIPSLKTSGSQTDSLDSPKVQRKKPGSDIDKGPLKFIPGPDGYHGKAYSKHQHTPAKVFQTSAQDTSREAVYANSKVVQSPEEEVVAELNSVIHEFTKNPNAPTGRSRFKDKRKVEGENGGTWPKCRAPNENGSVPSIPARPRPHPRQRPPLSEIVTLREPRSAFTRPVSAYVPNTKDSQFMIQPMHKSPPALPERSQDSCNTFVKHSPQGSDSTLKAYYAPPASQSKHGNSTFYTGTPTQDLMPVGKLQSPSEPNRNSSFESSSSASSSLHYANVQSPDTVQSVPFDDTVRSGYGHDRSSNHHRPNSAPSQSRRERREKAAAIHGPISHERAVPPASLAIPTIYSPRPIPHSRKPHHDPVISPLDRSGQLPLTSRPISLSHPTSVHHSQPVPSSVRSAYVAYPLPSHRSTTPIASPLSSTGPVSPRYSTPPMYLSNNSSLTGSSIPEMEDGRSLSYQRYVTPSPSPSQQSITAQSEDNIQPPVKQFMWNPTSDHGCATFPKRGAPSDRFHIPAPRIPTPSSIDAVSGRNSPMSPFPMPDYKAATVPRKRPRPQVGETREITVDKSSEPLGIQISKGSSGGIFVSSVSEKSLASLHGIEIGDQLLEVCGINMRNASYTVAANVLRQCGGTITMRVQYNPRKYRDNDSGSSKSSEDSNSSTPRRIAGTGRHSHQSSLQSDSLTPTNQTPTRQPNRPTGPERESLPPNEPRFVFLKKNSPDLGITLAGGNAVGIFVREVRPDSVAGGPQGLRCGDQMLEFNGENLRNATMEQAATLITKPAETVSILAQNNLPKFQMIVDQKGDSLYVRAGIDRTTEKDGELSFSKGDVLYVDNTMYQGTLGVWRAWLLDSQGQKIRCGTVPSKTSLEDELALKRSISGSLGDDDIRGSRRSSGSARRSLFRRKRHQRNNSKDSRDFISFSDASLNSDSIPMLGEPGYSLFQRVERVDGSHLRPVVILGPLADPLINKLTAESPDKYCRCQPEIVPALKMGQEENYFVDLKWRETHYEVITLDVIREVMSRNRHCMLDVPPVAVEQLHKMQIYPIVLFIKHKSPKQIREVKDFQFVPDKISSKTAKELHETFMKYEQDYKHLFTEVISGGGLALMCNRIKTSIINEQKKVVWKPVSSS